jgi:hypothetical protein
VVSTQSTTRYDENLFFFFFFFLANFMAAVLRASIPISIANITVNIFSFQILSQKPIQLNLIESTHVAEMRNKT